LANSVKADDSSSRQSQSIGDVLLAFVRIHVLHHAANDRIYGVEMREELKRHGYDISPGQRAQILPGDAVRPPAARETAREDTRIGR
jgi:hypothetical protein